MLSHVHKHKHFITPKLAAFTQISAFQCFNMLDDRLRKKLPTFCGPHYVAFLERG